MEYDVALAYTGVSPSQYCNAFDQRAGAADVVVTDRAYYIRPACLRLLAHCRAQRKRPMGSPPQRKRAPRPRARTVLSPRARKRTSRGAWPVLLKATGSARARVPPGVERRRG
jgi:hypothetical protein